VERSLPREKSVAPAAKVGLAASGLKGVAWKCVAQVEQGYDALNSVAGCDPALEQAEIEESEGPPCWPTKHSMFWR
jgi:hypothetical protein